MVEAVGIEPTSGSLRRQNLHAYPVSRSDPTGMETGKAASRTVPHQGLSPSPREGQGTDKPAEMTPQTSLRA